MEFSPVPASQGALEDHCNLLQTGFWGRFKSAFGWKALELTISGKEPLLVLLRPLGGSFCLAYVPHGPSSKAVKPGDWQGLKELASALKKLLPAGCIFIRFDPAWEIDIEDIGLKRHPGFYRATMDIQPPSTVILDLDRDEDEILRGMKKKHRYNIKLSGKKGVVVRESDISELPLWYHIYEETARRDRIALHEYGYYEKLFKMSGERTSRYPEIRLLLAEIEGEVEAGIIVSIQGTRATYLYGASSGNKRNFMPAYGLQWQAVQMVRNAGCLEYDLYGIPPFDDPEHPMAGLYRFKTGFGGRIVHMPGSWDCSYMPLFYGAYRFAESLRGWYYRKARKR